MCTLLYIFQQVFLLCCCGVASAPSMTGVAGNSCCTSASLGAINHVCFASTTTTHTPKQLDLQATQHATIAMFRCTAVGVVARSGESTPLDSELLDRRTC